MKSSTAAMSPLALGTSQPATEVMVETFRGTHMTPAMTRHCWLRLQTISSLYVSRPLERPLNPEGSGS